MDMIRGIAYLLIILSVLVVVHEWGHFAMAKIFRMRVEEFALFFGKVLLRLGVRNGTEYNIRAIPLGGFVRIAGMEADDISGGRPILQAIREPNLAGAADMDELLRQLDNDTMVGLDPAQVREPIRDLVRQAISDDGTLTSNGREELQSKLHSPQVTTDEHKFLELALSADSRANDPGLYSKKPIYQRALVIFAGPFMSLFFGYALFCIMGMTVGMPGDSATNQIIVMPGGAARDAGLQTGDRIAAIDGKPTPSGTALVDVIHKSIGIPLHLTVRRSGSEVDIIVTPRPSPKPIPVFRNGKPVLVDGKPVTKVQGLIGVQPIPIMERQGPVQSVVNGTRFAKVYMYQLITSIFSKQVRDNVGGPIAMGQMATAYQRLGAGSMVQLAATFSLSLGIMNLLPIPILDGGHLLLLAVEKLRRRKLSPREVYRAQVVGIGLLALIVTFVMYNDIVRTIGGKAIQ